MKNPIVLIEIENGMIQVYADKNILVAVHDRDTEGNDLGEADRQNNEDAFIKLAEKLDMHSGTGANEALQAFESPAPISWDEENARRAETRAKAIAYLNANIETFPQVAVHVWANIKPTAAGIDRVSRIGESTIVVSRDGYGATDIYDLADRDLIEVCVAVQKATEASN